MNYYRIENDNDIIDRWFLTEPLSINSDLNIDVWQFIAGNKVELIPDKLNADIQINGKELRFTLAGFDVPILSNDLINSMIKIDESGIQAVPIVINGNNDFSILVATRLHKCIDDENSNFTKWKTEDGRPEKLGKYRMFTKLSIDESAIPQYSNIFRIDGWHIALVVSETMRQAMISSNCYGVSFIKISG